MELLILICVHSMRWLLQRLSTLDNNKPREKSHSLQILLNLLIIRSGDCFILQIDWVFFFLRVWHLYSSSTIIEILLKYCVLFYTIFFGRTMVQANRSVIKINDNICYVLSRIMRITKWMQINIYVLKILNSMYNMICRFVVRNSTLLSLQIDGEVCSELMVQ